MVVIVILASWQVWWCLTCWATKRKPIGKSHQRYRGAGECAGYVPTGYGRYPTTEQGLEALIQQPANWRTPATTVPVDTLNDCQKIRGQ